MNVLDEVQVILDRLKARVADGTLPMPEMATISYVSGEDSANFSVYIGKVEDEPEEASPEAQAIVAAKMDRVQSNE